MCLSQTTNRKWWWTAKKCGPSFWKEVTLHKSMASEFLSADPTFCAKISCMLVRLCLIMILNTFCFIMPYFVLLHKLLFSEWQEYSNKTWSVASCCQWTAGAGKGDAGGIVKFVINLLPLDDFPWLISDIWRVVHSLHMREPPRASSFIGWCHHDGGAALDYYEYPLFHSFSRLISESKF